MARNSSSYGLTSGASGASHLLQGNVLVGRRLKFIIFIQMDKLIIRGETKQ
jgi:hypothetical protein